MPEDVLDQLDQELPEMDQESGLSFCGDLEDLYVEIMQDYIDSDMSAQLTDFLAAEDWKNYQIQVHALKSTSLTIGLADLSAEAKELEFACKDSNFGLVKEKHGALMAHYKKVVDTIKKAIEDNQ